MTRDTGYTLGVTVTSTYDETVDATRAALADQGFGILTEIDLKATLKAKLDVDVAPQVILGACRPQLAHQALAADPSVAAFLPCNVVVRAVDDATTRVEAFDPTVIVSMATDADDAAHNSDRRPAALADVATDARARLETALANLGRNLNADANQEN